MRRGISLGRWFGVPISVDYSWLAIAGFVTVILARGFDDVASGWLLWVGSAVSAFLFFLCVVVHELGHSLVARRRGIPVKRIRLFILGGVSELEHEAHTPNDELAVTLAGPLLSVLLGAVFFILGWAAGIGFLGDALIWLGSFNLILGVFNLLPGFPLDGGRVLRAFVWRATGNRVRATKIASTSGRVFGLLVISAGLVLTSTAYILDGLWLAMIGWFLYSTARSVGARPAVDPRTLDTPIRSVMLPVRTYLGLTAPITALTPDLGVWVPVLDPWGEPLGVVQVDSLTKIPMDRWPSTTVGDVMRPCSAVVSFDDTVAEALQGVTAADWVLLVTYAGTPVGVLDVMTLSESLDSVSDSGLSLRPAILDGAAPNGIV